MSKKLEPKIKDLAFLILAFIMYGRLQQGNPPRDAKPMVDCDKKSQALFATPNMPVFTESSNTGICRTDTHVVK